jgi:hypothetical protein
LNCIAILDLNIIKFEEGGDEYRNDELVHFHDHEGKGVSACNEPILLIFV